MAKPEKPRSGFVIKLSNETAQKLAEEEQLAKSEAIIRANETDGKNENVTGEKQETSVEVSSTETTDAKPTDASSSNEENTEKDSSDAANPEWGDYAPFITYEGEDAIYTDPSTKQRYTWSQDTNSWATKDEDTSRVYSYEDDTHVYTEADGSKSFWDEKKKAWLPKVDDDFLAFYQMSYGFIENKAEEKKDEKAKEVQKKSKSDNPPGLKRKVDPTWFEQSEEKNTKVYVSNLPLDINEEDFVNFMQKCGLVERDPTNQKMKVKLYIDKDQNCFKGDALCTYIKIESVDLALKLLDGCDFKGHKVKVEKASFQLKGEYNPALKPKKKRKKELEKLKKMQQKLFDWRPEKFIGERSKHERIVIVKNLFHPADFDNEVQLILDYQQDLREECGKSGEVRKVVIYDRHPEGVAQITMKEPEQADAVVALINGRWFGKKQITAEIWDGRTKYRIAETEADLNKRVDKWGRFLEGKEDDDKKDGENKTDDAKVSSKTTDVSEDTTKSVEDDAMDTKNVPDISIDTTNIIDESTDTTNIIDDSTDTPKAVADCTDTTNSSTGTTNIIDDSTDTPKAVVDCTDTTNSFDDSMGNMETCLTDKAN
ncbi:HIV Tat-specific factor 1-like protein [Operophtera brumata]|uniref:17S U2 SnRNP complex component HTATSF1 n=1 Tax=Operophtera brumata TaxID=104452 RepID=A0A0L7KT78_OPEBR|nr:HIV Tat-specific factor 1-like protein [Operophtera brumata]